MKTNITVDDVQDKEYDYKRIDVKAKEIIPMWKRLGGAVAFGVTAGAVVGCSYKYLYPIIKDAIGDEASKGMIGAISVIGAMMKIGAEG